MTDDRRTGRELTPRDTDHTDVVIRETEVAPSAVDRFYAGQGAHTVGMTEERAAQIVRQSGNARRVAFLVGLVVALFIPIYWFYDLGFPALAGSSRLDSEKVTQQVTDIGRGYALYIANCARCHGPDGKGGIGPPLNDPAKLYNAVTAEGQAGTGHLNPTYLHTVLEVGGRYVCGDPKSIMPAWLQPAGPLNYRQVEEVISFLTASTQDRFAPPAEAHAAGAGETAAAASPRTGWRDPAYAPAPDASPVPACWRNPSGQIGGAGGGSGPSAAPVASAGTADAPRVIDLGETASLQITDDKGAQIIAIPVKKGETVTFKVTNTAGFAHNFYIGTDEQLKANDRTATKGTPDFSDGTQELSYTFDTDAQLHFGCIVPGHYQAGMGGMFQIQP